MNLRGDCRALQNDIDNGRCGSGKGILFFVSVFLLWDMRKEGRNSQSNLQ